MTQQYRHYTMGSLTDDYIQAKRRHEALGAQAAHHADRLTAVAKALRAGAFEFPDLDVEHWLDAAAVRALARELDDARLRHRELRHQIERLGLKLADD